jgi:hypothetical protein
LRISACRLMFRAALRYFADSERSEVERCDMPKQVSQQDSGAFVSHGSIIAGNMISKTHGPGCLPARADLPCSSS